MYTPQDNHLRAKKPVKLGEAISRYVETLVPAQARPGFELQQAWEKVTSPEVSKHTDTVMFSKRNEEPIVIVYVDDSSWAAELNMQREFYRIVLEKELSRPVAEVKFYASRTTSLRKN